jgi:two-component system, chemotaxis family, protein-glutamate methylesterase/glutaminase
VPSILVIGASAGGLVPVCKIAERLPASCPLAVFIVVHIGARASRLPELLSRVSKLPASFGQDDIPFENGHIYVAPPDHHMLLAPGRIRLSQSQKIHRTRPAVDPLFQSAAEAYGDQVVGVVLSGGDGDGAAGVQALKAHGGEVLVQRPDDALIPSMPLSAIVADHPTCLPIDDLARKVAELCSREDHCSVGTAADG